MNLKKKGIKYVCINVYRIMKVPSMMEMWKIIPKERMEQLVQKSLIID